MVQYTLKKAEVEGSEDSIEMVGHTHTFKMSDVKAHMLQIAKNITALQGQIRLEKAKLANIEHFHPYVKEFNKAQLTAIAVYAQATGVLEKALEFLEADEKQHAQYMADLKVIAEQTGLSFTEEELKSFEPTPEPSPEELAAKQAAIEEKVKAEVAQEVA